MYTTVLKHSGSYERVLEIGPGATVGTLFCFLANGAKTAYGLDISPIEINPDDQFFRDLKTLLAIVGSAGWWHRQMAHPSLRDKLELIDCWTDLDERKLASQIKYFAPFDASNLPFEDNSFDFLYSGAVLENIADPDTALKEMYRVLRPGGLMSHGIDLRSHNNKGWLSLYTLTEDEHRALSEKYDSVRGISSILSGDWQGQVYCNRVLSHQWKELVLARNFEILEFTENAKVKKELIDPKMFTKPFCDFSPEELSVLTVGVVARKR